MLPSKENFWPCLAKNANYMHLSQIVNSRRNVIKKHFINGLMTACRVVGISFEELNTIIEQMPKKPIFKDLDEQLSVPTYVRNRVDIKL